MVEPIDSRPILEKLLAKTQEGKVPWEAESGVFGRVGGGDQFSCALDDGIRFEVGNVEDTFWILMKDSSGREIFQERVQDEIVYRNPDREIMFNLVHDIYELARRKVLGVNQKLADAAAVLDKL